MYNHLDAQVNCRWFWPGLSRFNLNSEEYGVSGLWVFGSYVRGEQVEPTSDVDVLVEFDGPGMTLFKFVELEDRIAEHLGLRVDLVQRSALRPRIRPAILAEAVAV